MKSMNVNQNFQYFCRVCIDQVPKKNRSLNLRTQLLKNQCKLVGKSSATGHKIAL